MMEKGLKNINVKKQFYNMSLIFDFPIQINNIDGIVDVSLNIDGAFTFFSYIIKTKHVDIERINYNLQKELDVNKMIENISDILKNNLIIAKNIPVDIEQIKDDIYKYSFILKENENRMNNFKYCLQIERYRIDNGFSDFEISISFGINEKIDNIEKILETIKLILKNIDIIEKEVKNKIKEIIINKIENIEWGIKWEGN